MKLIQIKTNIVCEHLATYNKLNFVRSSKDCFEYIKGITETEWRTHLYKESFYVIFMTRANKIIGHEKISEGGTAGTVVDPKLIFQSALLANAASIILVHNHPSGNLRPSQADLSITKKLVEGGKLLEIQVLDHIIIAMNPDVLDYMSFADGCLM